MRSRRTMLVRASLVSFLAIPSCDTPMDAPPSMGGMLERGVTVGDWTPSEIASAAGESCLDDVVDARGNFVVFLVTLRQRTAASDFLDSPNPPTPDVDALREAAAGARARGLGIVLKLHVDVDDGTWRALIRPSELETWFADYGRAVDVYAEVAEEIGAEGIVIGTELTGTIERESSWRALIATTREKFGGRVLYAASWDEADRVPFWDALDAVGVNAYFPVAGRHDASRMDMLAAWQPWLARLLSLSRRAGKDVVFTEIGYRSVDGAGMEPSFFQPSGAPDAGEQADLYWAALTAIEGATFVRGMYWWNFLVSPDGEAMATDYSPQDKPAFDVLRAAWEGTT